MFSRQFLGNFAEQSLIRKRPAHGFFNFTSLTVVEGFTRKLRWMYWFFLAFIKQSEVLVNNHIFKTLIYLRKILKFSLLFHEKEPIWNDFRLAIISKLESNMMYVNFIARQTCQEKWYCNGVAVSIFTHNF